MGIEFNVAAKAKEARDLRADGEEEAADELEYVEVPIEDVVYKATRPSANLTTLLTTTTAAELPRLVFIAIGKMMGQDAVRHVRKLMADEVITLADLWMGTEQNPNGLIPQILSEFAGRPTEPSTDSAASPSRGGRKSTRSTRAPGKSSTSSTSGSTAS